MIYDSVVEAILDAGLPWAPGCEGVRANLKAAIALLGPDAHGCDGESFGVVIATANHRMREVEHITFRLGRFGQNLPPLSSSSLRMRVRIAGDSS